MPASTRSAARAKASAGSTTSTSAQAQTSTTLPSSSPSPSLFFWREYEEPYGFLSQWYNSPFNAPSLSSATTSVTSAAELGSTNGASDNQMLTFNTTEQYMMYRKALLFKDTEIAAQIMREPEPKKQRALGRKVKGFEHKLWDREKSGIVEEGNWWKFTGTKGGDLGKKLGETGERELVEASPYDRIWGVGYAAAHAEANRERWGENLLGKALVRVRERLRSKDEEEGKS